QAEDGIRDKLVTGVQTCALPISSRSVNPAGYIDGGGYADDEVLAGSTRGATITMFCEVIACSGVIVRPASHEAAKSFSPRRVREIGRASCRERVWISWVAVSFM